MQERVVLAVFMVGVRVIPAEVPHRMKVAPLAGRQPVLSGCQWRARSADREDIVGAVAVGLHSRG